MDITTPIRQYGENEIGKPLTVVEAKIGPDGSWWVLAEAADGERFTILGWLNDFVSHTAGDAKYRSIEGETF